MGLEGLGLRGLDLIWGFQAMGAEKAIMVKAYGDHRF